MMIQIQEERKKCVWVFFLINYVIIVLCLCSTTIYLISIFMWMHLAEGRQRWETGVNQSL